MKRFIIVLTVVFTGISGSLMSQMQHHFLVPDAVKLNLLPDVNQLTFVPGESGASPDIPFAMIPSASGFNNHSVKAASAPPTAASVNLTGESWFLNVNAGSSYLHNKDIKNSDWVIKTNLGYQAEFGYSNRFSDLFSYGIGIGFSSYPSEISAKSLTDTLNGMDFEGVQPNDPVERRISYRDVNEKTTIMYIEVPVFLEIGNTNYDKAGFFLQVGARISYPVMNSLDGSGNYDIRGYYPDYDTEITGVPELGYVEEEQLFTGEQELKLNPYNISGTVAGGFSFPMSEKLIIRLSASYVHGFTDISGESEELTGNPVTNKSHMLSGGESKVFTRSFGGIIGIIYQINVR
ncbi:MAG: outer membrane beta-barrel protein [Bacteroidota bacterium]